MLNYYYHNTLNNCLGYGDDTTEESYLYAVNLNYTYNDAKVYVDDFVEF